MLTRRNFVRLLSTGFAASALVGTYAIIVEPAFRLMVTTWRPRLANWPEGLPLKIAILTDLHACEPWMGARRIAGIVETANALKPDIILLLGDYVSSMRFVTRHLHAREWSSLLGKLSAPLGVHAVLGNHDWWADRQIQRTGKGLPFAARALKRNGINVLHNTAEKIDTPNGAFWLAGLGDQLAFAPSARHRHWKGTDDLPATLAEIKGPEPAILMAHEPDIFPKVPDRFALTFSGHTHGGQVNLMGWRPIVPSRYGPRYAYGHIVENTRNLIVSSGLGCSIAPIRFGNPPEVVVVELGKPQSA